MTKLICVIGKNVNSLRDRKDNRLMILLIEKGTEKDLNELEALYNNVNDSLEKWINYPGWKKGVYPIRENAAIGVQEGNLYVARQDNRIAGSIILNHKTEHGYETAEWKVEAAEDEVLIIHTLVVHPDFQNQKVGSELLRFAEELGAQDKIKALRLDVYEKNAPAIKLYERCGFKYIATVDLGYRKYGLDWFKLYEKEL